MERMNAYAPKIATGVNVIDEAWGGLYRGGSYVVYGPARSGRSLLTLQFANIGVRSNQRTLYVFPDRPRDLIIQAASIHFDLRGATENDLVKLMRIPPSFKASDLTDTDLRVALLDLAELARKEDPDRLVIENFNRFTQFDHFGAFQDAFREMLETLELVDTTILFALGEPANENARKVVDFISRQVTGSIHITPDGEDPFALHRKVTIVPNIGHLEGAIADYWNLNDTISENRTLADRSNDPPVSDDPSENNILSGSNPEPLFASAETAGGFSAVPGFLPGRVRSLAALRAERESGQLRTDHEESVATPVETDSTVPESDFRYHPSPPPLPNRESYDTFSTDNDAIAEDPETAIAEEDENPDTLSYSQIAEINAAAIDPNQYSDRNAFLAELDRQYERKSEENHPFLLIAMRMNRSEEREVRPFDFEFILDLVIDSLSESDRLLVTHEKERLVILRTEIERETDEKDFFKTLTRRLQEEAPKQAEHLIQSVAALTVHDGKPFKSAREFLDYLDKS